MWSTRLCSERAASFCVKGIRWSGNHPKTINQRYQHSMTTDTYPQITQPSVWTSMVPKFLRNRPRAAAPSQNQRSKQWNPATFFIVAFMLVGSNAIQMIALKHDIMSFSRKAEAKLDILREVIRRLQAGEEVDIAGALGTGDEDQEREWGEGKPHVHAFNSFKADAS